MDLPIFAGRGGRKTGEPYHDAPHPSPWLLGTLNANYEYIFNAYLPYSEKAPIFHNNLSGLCSPPAYSGRGGGFYNSVYVTGMTARNRTMQECGITEGKSLKGPSSEIVESLPTVFVLLYRVSSPFLSISLFLFHRYLFIYPPSCPVYLFI